MKKFFLFLIVISLVFNHNVLYGAFGIGDVAEPLQMKGPDSLSTSVIDVVLYLLGFVALIGVIWLMKAGFQILTAGGDEEKVKAGKKTLLFALLGIVVIWGAWALTSGIITGLDENL